MYSNNKFTYHSYDVRALPQLEAYMDFPEPSFQIGAFPVSGIINYQVKWNLSLFNQSTTTVPRRMPWSAGKRSNQFLISIYYYCWPVVVGSFFGSLALSHASFYCLFAMLFVCPSVFVAYVFMIRIRLLSLLAPYRPGLWPVAHCAGESRRDGMGIGIEMGWTEMRWTAFCVPIPRHPIGSGHWRLQVWNRTVTRAGHKKSLFKFHCFLFIFIVVFLLGFFSTFRFILYKSRRLMPYRETSGWGWLDAVFVDVRCPFRVTEDVHWLWREWHHNWNGHNSTADWPLAWIRIAEP